MRHTIILKKVIKEVIGLIVIVLFIYTCTKSRSVINHKKAAANENIRPICVPAIRLPE